ncbi:MAG: hypothetical protein JW881_06175 [Spirochaetales bacterium]|nr:hypothetical protein [Spirochaetales bacterium]
MIDKSSYDRINVTLPPHLNEWLLQFSLEIKKAGGYKLPKTLIIRSFIRAIKESGLSINLKNIRDDRKKGIADKVSSIEIENLLVSRILAAIREYGTSK